MYQICILFLYLYLSFTFIFYIYPLYSLYINLYVNFEVTINRYNRGKSYKENSHLEKYEIILAIISLIFVCGGHLLMIYYNLSETGIILINLFFVLFMILMKVVFGV